MPVTRNDSQRDFAITLAEMEPDFYYTRGLYLDFEGSGKGYEHILSLFWPMNPGPERFGWIWRDLGQSTITREQLDEALMQMGCSRFAPEAIVVFSGGDGKINEQVRFEQLFGENVFPNAEWIDLLRPLRRSRTTRKRIREGRRVMKVGRKIQDNSLEALELEFGIRRSKSIRTADHIYSDGVQGDIRILDLAKRVIDGEAGSAEERRLYEYCQQDVSGMFQIARLSQKIVERPPDF